MIKTQIENLELTDFQDVAEYLNNAYYDMQVNTGKIDVLFWKIEREGLNTEVLSSIEDFLDNVYRESKSIFDIEEYIYEELKQVLPEQSSISALKTENMHILTLFETIKNMINNKAELKNNKELLQAEMITVAGLIERNIHKKEGIMLHEAATLIPEERHLEIIKKIKDHS